MRIVRCDGVLVIQIQGADESCLQLGEEMKRTAEEGNMAADRFTAGKAADRLVDHRLENGGGQIFSGSTLVDQRLDIRLGKNAAAGGDRVDGLVIFGVFIQTGRIRLDEGRHLVDKGTGTAGADTVHTLLDISALKIDDLGVLAAELDGNVCLGRIVLSGRWIRR